MEYIMRGCALRTRDKPFRGHKLEIRKDEVSNCINMVTKDYLLLVIPKSTSTRSKYMKNNLEENVRIAGWHENENVIAAHQGDKKRSTVSEHVYHKPSGIMTTLKTNGAKVIELPVNTRQETSATSPKSTQTNYQTLTASLAASLAKHFLSQGSEKDLKTPEGHSSLTLREYCEQNSLDYSSLKTLKDFSVTTVGELSKPSSKRLMNWGMTVNGKCLTARITESPKTESVSTLSDILEEHPDQKYFLSEKALENLMTSQFRSQMEVVHDPSFVSQTLKSQGEKYKVAIKSAD